MLEFIFMKIRPSPQTGVNHMRESLATGNLKSQTQKLIGKVARHCIAHSEKQKGKGANTTTPSLHHQNVFLKKGGVQFTQVLCPTERSFY